MAEKYIADDANCTTWVAGMQWMEYQWACDDENDRKIRCLLPNQCSTYDPNDSATINTFNGAEVWNLSTTSGQSASAVWGSTRTMDPVDSPTKADPSERDPADAAAWREGKPYFEGELIIETGMMYECLDTTGLCETARPSSTATASQSIWAVPTEDGLDVVPASKEVTMEAWALTYDADQADPEFLSSAYEVGSMATTRDGNVWICDPAVASYG
jgi:hypothetical protein